MPSTMLADVLHSYMRRPDLTYTPSVVSKLSGVPKATIMNWLDGVVAKPRRWQDLVRVADALRLDAQEADHLLAVAGYPPIGVLRERADAADRALFGSWRDVRQLGATASLLGPPTNTITSSVTLVGRETERADVQALLMRPEVRLLTLTGPGGTGKTRLARQVVTDLCHMFSDGVFLVGLASLTDSNLVLSTITHTLGVTETTDQPLVERLKAVLHAKQMLLVIDSFEHLLPAAPLLGELLQAAPRLNILVTSRVVLRLYDEYEFPVPPLALPNLARLPAFEQLRHNPAVMLFVQRTQAIQPDFVLTPANAATVAEICVRLDGLPLAIELAAMRGKLLTPAELLARLDQRLAVLTDGPSNLPERQQTLRATIAWSYNLLDAHAKWLLSCLSVFMGGWTVAAAEAVGQEQPSRLRAVQYMLHLRAEAPHVLDSLMLLVDSSLISRVETSDGTSRFMMLETIREYAYEQVVTSGNAQTAHRNHAAYYLRLAETAEPELVGPGQVAWLAQLEMEHDNMRAALRWAIGQGEAEWACRIGAALWRFWAIRGYLNEGRHWLEMALAKSHHVPATVQSKAYLAAGRLARQQADLERAQAWLETALALQQSHGDQQTIAFLLGSLGVVAYDQGDFARARVLHEQSLAIRRSLNDTWGIAATLTNLGEVARQMGDRQRAIALQEESLSFFSEAARLWGIALTLTNLGLLVFEQGAYDQARIYIEESLMLWQTLGERVNIAECLEGLAAIAAAQAQPERAARLGGAAQALRDAVGAPLSPADRARYHAHLAPARAALADTAFTMAWQAGSSMSLDQTVLYALDT